jgi:predicted nicotinamide N-methyase
MGSLELEEKIHMRANVRAHRADEMKDATGSAASEADLHPIWWTLYWACAKHSNSTGE